MTSDDWVLFKVAANGIEANRIADFLNISGVPAYVDEGALGVGLDGGHKIYVAAELLHRARWVSADAGITDEELEFLATGKLPNADT